VTYRSQPFDPQTHDVTSFRCGEPSLDDWIRQQAVPATARRTARTWVWLDKSETVVAYYALAAHKISRDELPRKIGRGGPAEIPAVLLARLALCELLRGNLGEVLLADAMSRVVAATRIVAARVVVVDALHEKVAAFYERLGFRRVPDSLVLVQKIADIEAALNKASSR
jgi:hypothetical protein